MARLSCAKCGWAVGAAEVVCPRCGVTLLHEGAVRRDSTAAPQPEPDTAPTTAAPDTAAPDTAAPAGQPAECPHCHAVVPKPTNTVCLECLRPLRQAERTAPTTGTFATTREATVTVVLRFAAGAVELTTGRRALLGRDLAGTHANLFAANDNVSRRHATVGVEPDGSTWVQDEGSTNGTFIDGMRITPGARIGLTDGAELRLASDVRASVSIKAGHG